MSEEEPKVNLFFRKPPYGTSHVYELARIGMSITAMDLPTRAIFENDGVLCLVKNQQSKVIHTTPMTESVLYLQKYDVKLFVVQEALDKYDLSPNDLLENLDLTIIPRKDLVKLMEEAKFTMEV